PDNTPAGCSPPACAHGRAILQSTIIWHGWPIRRIHPAARGASKYVTPPERQFLSLWREHAILAAQQSYLAVGEKRMKLRHGARTGVGKTRDHNEDNVGVGSAEQVEQLGELLAICDGMGGHAAGEVASQI